MAEGERERERKGGENKRARQIGPKRKRKGKRG